MAPVSSEDRPRIAIIVTAEVTATSFVTNFARYMAGQGYDVTIVADGIVRYSENIGKGKLSQVSIPMEREPHPFKDLCSLILLIGKLKQINPTVLTYATPKASLLGSIAGFVVRVPVRIYQLWGLRLETVKGPKRTILTLLERLTSLLSTRVLANSPSLAARYQDLRLNSGHTVDILGKGSSHGVDIEWFSEDAISTPLDEATRDHLQNRGRDVVIGFVGRLHPDKGIDTLLDAVRIVKAADVSVNLVLVGSDEGAALDLSQGLEDDTIVVGKVGDPRPYYAGIDMLVLPSLREGFPNVVLEAASMCVPAIVSNGTGVIDSVIDGVTGLVVPVGEPAPLAQAIIKLAQDGDLRRRLGSSARTRAEQYFGQKQVWDRTSAYLFGQSE